MYRQRRFQPKARGDRSVPVSRTLKNIFFFPVVLMNIFLLLLPAAGQSSKEPGPLKHELTVQKDPSPEPLNQRFAALLQDMKNGHYGTVISGCKEIIRTDSSFHQAFRLLLDASVSEDKTASARPTVQETLSFLENSLRRDPKSSYYFYGLGLYYKKVKNYVLAAENLEKSVSLGAPFWEAYEELLICYETKADIGREDAFLKNQIRVHPDNPLLRQAQGVIYYLGSEYAAALKAMETALAVHLRRGDTKAQARCLAWMSYVAAYSNDYRRSLELVKRGLKISRESGDKAEEAYCLFQISFIWIDLGNYSQALKSCLRALTILEEFPDRTIENLCRRALGIVQLELGNTLKAREYLESTLAFYEDEHDLRGQDICLYWLTLLHKDRGDFARAMDCAERALKISRRIGFKTGEAFHLTSIGDLYLSLGNYERALEFNEQALRVTEEYVSKWSREECLSTIGFVYLEMQDYPRALEYFERALKYIQKIGHERKVAQCLSNIGNAYFKLGDLGRASEYFLRSLASAQRSGNKMVQALNYDRQGDLLNSRGQIEEAKKYYERALALGNEIGQPGIVWQAYAGLGSLFAQQKDVGPAIAFYKNAVDVIEDVRNQIQVREYSAGFFKSKIPIYENLLNLLSERNSREDSPRCAEECFYYAERARARSLLDDLQQAKIDPASLPAFRDREVEIGQASRRVSELVSELNNPSLSKKERDELLQKFEKAEDEFQGLIDGVKRERFSYMQVLAPRPFTAPEIQARLLNQDTALIEYFVGEKNIFIFSLTRDNLIARRLPNELSGQTLRLMNDYIKLLASKNIDLTDCLAPGERLYEMLLMPVLAALPQSVHKLIIVPDRNLNYLPFETLSRLKNGHAKKRTFLIEDYSISYAPSAATLIQIMEKRQKNRSQKELLAIGDPIIGGNENHLGHGTKSEDFVQEYYLERRFVLSALPFASKEIEAISRFVPKDEKRILCREEATEGNVKKTDLSGYKIIHFATHGLVDERVASRSALVLNLNSDPSEDGFFQLSEIYQTQLDADLVVLSACQTARGKMEPGEGVQGLSRGFFCAGARSVVASLWNVNDRSAAEFMKRFYQYLRQGKTKQDALRLTKLRMIHSRYDRPYDWAPFILIGEADALIALSKLSLLDRLSSF